jgi:hypothetical protein
MTRTALSSGCAALGVVLIVYGGIAPDEWHSVPALFAGLALLCVSHALTPCLDRIAVWRKQLLK